MTTINFDSATNKKFAKEFLYCEVYEIKFNGEDCLLIGDMTDGAIATEWQYTTGKPSYAHLCRDGKVRRFMQVMGSKDDIEIIKKRK